MRWLHEAKEEPVYARLDSREGYPGTRNVKRQQRHTRVPLCFLYNNGIACRGGIIMFPAMVLPAARDKSPGTPTPACRIIGIRSATGGTLDITLLSRTPSTEIHLLSWSWSSPAAFRCRGTKRTGMTSRRISSPLCFSPTTSVCTS